MRKGISTFLLIAVLGGSCLLSGGCRKGGEGGSSTVSPTATSQTLGRASLDSFGQEFPGVPGRGAAFDTSSVLQVEAREVDPIVKDLQPWLGPTSLPEPQQRAFEQFCRLLAVCYRCDRAVRERLMSDKQLVMATQPLIDRLAALGKPAEDVLLRLLSARRKMDPQQRAESLCREDPEVYGAIVLWTLKSRAALPLFMEEARNKLLENRGAFVRGLGKIGDPRALEFLRQLAAEEADEIITSETVNAIKAIEAAQTKPAPAAEQK